MFFWHCEFNLGSSWIKPTNYIRNVKFLIVDCHSHDGFTVPLLQLTYNPNHHESDNLCTDITSYPLIEKNGDQVEENGL